MSKKGLSPVIATVLLVALVLILAVIIFLWARAFLPEKLTKDIGGGPITVEDACKEVAIDADYSSGVVVIQNQGNVPLYGVEIGIKKGAFGSLEYIPGDFTAGVYVTKAGESNRFDVGSSGVLIESGDEIVIVPVLLGASESDEKKAYSCDLETGRTVKVP